MQPEQIQSQPGDKDLVEHIKNLLTQEGFTEQQVMAFTSNNNINLAKNAPSYIQRLEINQYFLRHCFRTVETIPDTIRLCLTPMGEVDEWLILFQNKVIPYLKENSIPRTESLYG